MWRMLVILVLVVVVVLAVVGYYRDWYHVGTVSSPEGGQSGVQVTVDKNKVQSDIDKAKQRVVPTHTESESH